MTWIYRYDRFIGTPRPARNWVIVIEKRFHERRNALKRRNLGSGRRLDQCRCSIAPTHPPPPPPGQYPTHSLQLLTASTVFTTLWSWILASRYDVRSKPFNRSISIQFVALTYCLRLRLSFVRSNYSNVPQEAVKSHIIYDRATTIGESHQRGNWPTISK